MYKLRGKGKELKALNNINFSIKEGETFGLLGPNGAGKTTLISILTGLKQPTQGRVFMDGLDVTKNTKQVKSKFALMMDYKLLYNRITAYDNLKFMCKLYKIHNYKPKINKIVEEFGIRDWLDQYVSSFSLGMKMKLALCRTLLLDRKILILDEPTLGLDVKSKQFVINKLRTLEKTILLTSHDMNVVEKLCDRIAFIKEGKIIKIGNKRAIKKVERSEVSIFIKLERESEILIKELNNYDFILNAYNEKNGIRVSLRNRKYFRDLLSILGNFEVYQLKEEEFSLEDLFLRIIE